MSKITPEHLTRQAIVYIRQSTPDQVAHNLEVSGANTVLPIGRDSSAGARSSLSMMTSAAPAAASRGPASRNCWPPSAKDASAP